MSTNHYEVVIIGAGFSGLAAGIRLAHFGKKVLILERHNAPGGLNSFYSRNGRKFDVGLHALTNYPQPRIKGPLNRLARHLRINLADLELAPQKRSRVITPQGELVFDNTITTLEASIATLYPQRIDAFRRMVAALPILEEALSHPHRASSGRAFLEAALQDPQLVDHILCPLCYYGSAREGDIDFAQLVILFRSIFLEGLSRPEEGIRPLIRMLLERYRSTGGERRMACGVRQIQPKGGHIVLELDNGDTLTADCVFSSIGAGETARLLGKEPLPEQLPAFSFFETQMFYPIEETQGHWDDTIVFFSLGSRFEYRAPRDLIDLQGGVICLSHNYQYKQMPTEGCLRVTALANSQAWKALEPAAYVLAKQQAFEQLQAQALKILPTLPHPLSPLAVDTFSPKTVERYTGHIHGSVYGSPIKSYDGKTELDNVHLIGTDQGLLGIVGSMVSGVLQAQKKLEKTG